VTRPFDVAIVGSGFAGSLTALLLRSLGRSVILIEKGTHPRFAIGESSSPLANLLLESLCERYGLSRIAPLAAWGTWQRRYPEVACGLKRGFTFYGHGAGRPFRADPDRTDQLLVAASPNDEVADTHWYRADFDHLLLREACDVGAEYVDRTAVTGLSWQGETASLETLREGRSATRCARLVVDASGPGGFLHRALGLEEAPFPGLPQTQGLYTHFTGVRRLDAMGIFPALPAPPYPVDDAAVHHVFDGGWIWVLRFNNGVTSAGVAATPRLAEELRLAEGAPAWDRLLERFPTVRDQFASSRALLPFVHRPRLPFRSAIAAGPNWTMLPSAAAFVDPILSTGFPLTLLGIERLIRAVESLWGRKELSEALARDGRRSLAEADTAALLTAALYARFHDFPAFAALTLLYFAAASFAEASRRLGRAHRAGDFLSGDHPSFGPALRESCGLALAEPPVPRSALLQRIRRGIEPLDVIGLSDERRRNWYPVDAADLRAAAAKLEATPGEIEELLARMMRPADAPLTAASASGRSAGAAAPRPLSPAVPPAPPR
jgi:FADH2 O2-dependent halogenase